MYERLTVRDEYGNADIIGVDSADLQLNLGFKELNIVTNTLNRLAEFEDIGLSPDEIIGMKSLCEKTYDDLRHRVNTAEKEVEQLRAELERTKAERDAAVGDVEKMMAQDFHPSALRAKAVNTMAIAALREQAERSKGCVWCKSDSKVTHNGEHFCFFCSYCGKRLEVES